MSNPLFTAEELEELKRIDAELDSQPITMAEYEAMDLIEELLFPEKFTEKKERVRAPPSGPLRRTPGRALGSLPRILCGAQGGDCCKKSPLVSGKQGAPPHTATRVPHTRRPDSHPGAERSRQTGSC